ncbi:MAG: hypothetical protein P4L51_17725 [Puia sp.]|nr:hypothetical protein [Puia sp.]
MNKMNYSPRFSLFNLPKQATSLCLAVLLCCFAARAQTSKPQPKPAITTAKPPTSSTTTAGTTTASATPAPATTAATVKTTVIDEAAHMSQTKILTFHDPEYKKTTDYANRQKKYAKTMDDTARKTVAYSTDGSKIQLKLVKNPSFGGMPTTIKSTTAKGSEKKEVKKTDSIQWDCASSSIALTASSTSFLNADYSGTAGYIYPGAIYTFDNFFNGNLIEQAGVRYPITLVNENPNISGSAYVVVKDPGMAKTTNALDKLRGEMKGAAGNEDFKYQVYETGNSAAQSLQVSGGGSYDGFSAQNTYSTSGTSNSVSLTIDATKILYTINMAPQDSGFFADPRIESTRNLMVIGRVSYGVRVLANLTYTFNTTQEADQFKASYSGFGGSANVSLNQMSQSASVSNTINCYVVGGASGKTTMSFDKKDLEKRIQGVFSAATYQNAVPVAYTFFDMAGDLVGSYSSTDHFNERSCVPNTSGARLKSAWVSFTTGVDGKDNDTHYTVSLYGGNAGSANNYNGYDNNPPQTVNNHEPFIAEYKTGPLNVVFTTQQTSTNPLTMNAFPLNQAGSIYHDLNMDYFVKNGGIVHLHIYPNGNDTWDIQSMNLQLNFDGAPTQNITFGKFQVSQNSTEMTLYFDGTFHQK